VGEPCDQHFEAPQNPTAFFAYSSSPVAIATTIGEAIEKLKRLHKDTEWLPWAAMDPRGQVLFCKICRSLRQSSVLIADVTTLNFNLMFEIGFAIGLGMPVMLIRDTSLAAEQRLFAEVGILDTFAYIGFRNSESSLAAYWPIPDHPPFQMFRHASTGNSQSSC
jgi:hypothetical protein